MEDQQYFPRLERCLKGDHLLLSWQEAYTSLCHPQNASSPGLQSFLAESTTQDILKNPFAPFEPHQGTDNGQPNSDFAARTAAIHVAPEENGPYDIKQIKTDALSLAQTLNIDKVAALRIVILEWQRQPTTRMLSRPLNEEDHQAPDDFLDISIFAPKSSTANAPTGPGEQPAKTFDSTYSRQLRHIKLAVTEASYVLAVSELKTRQYAVSRGEKEQAVDYVGKNLFEAASPFGDASQTIVNAVGGFRKCLDTLGMDGQHPTDKNKNLEKYWEDLEPFWYRTHLMRMVSYPQYIFTVADSSSLMPTSESVLAYFELMKKHDFFMNIDDTTVPGLAGLARKLQTMVQLASLALLRLDMALDSMDAVPGEVAYSSLAPGASHQDYLLNTDCIRKLHSIFEETASEGIHTAALSMLAWSCIYLALREAAQSSRRGSTDSNTSGAVPSPVQPSPDKRREAFRQALRAIRQDSGHPSQDLEQANLEQRNSFELIGTSAIVQFQVFAQITGIVSSLRSDFGTGVHETFDIRSRGTLLTLITAGASLVIYGEQTLSAVLAVIGGDRSYWDLADREVGKFDPVAQAFLENPAMMHRFLGESLGRYPEEATPYYRILRTLFLNSKLNYPTDTQLWQALVSAETFTRRLPQGFRMYDEAVDVVTGIEELLAQRLFGDLPYFISRNLDLSRQRSAITNGTSRARSSYGDNCVPAQTIGLPADESERPIVVAWNHQFSPLYYMTGCLYTVLAGNDWVDASTGCEVPLEDVSEIVSLLSVVIMTNKKSGKEESEAHQSLVDLIDTSFVEANPRLTLLAIVAEIFETQLQNQQVKPGDAVSMDLLIQCVRFFHAVAVCLPGRIWPILSRSKLLELDGNGGSLAAIVTSVEMINGQYDFLIGCIRLFDALVDASLRPGREDSQGPSKALSKLNPNAATHYGGETLPERMASTILTSFSKTLVSVYRNSRSWRYVSPSDRSVISTRLSQIFDRILHYTLGIDDEADMHLKAVTSILADSAIYLGEILLSTSPSHQLSETLIDMLVDGLGDVMQQQFLEAELWPINQVESALRLCSTALQIGVSRDVVDSCLEQALLKNAPILARLYAAHDGIKASVATLLRNMITLAGRSQSEPAALLGYMGPSTAQDFLAILGGLNRPMDNIATEIAIWKMLSAVVSSRQQRFAISLLTNTPQTQRPKKTGDKDVKKSRIIPVLSYALNEISSISAIPRKDTSALTRALAILEFVALCQNHWAWAVGEIRTHPRFIAGITSYVRSLHREEQDAPEDMCTETTIAATVAEVLAMYLHAAAQVGDADAVQKVAPHLQYFKKYGVASPVYAKLHVTMRDNLALKHGGVLPDSFKHTGAFDTELGDNYFYDVAFASKVLSMRKRTPAATVISAREEFRRANVNLSNVEAQIKLLKQWKFLVIQLSKATAGNNEVTELLIEVVKQCLQENAGSDLPERVFRRLRHHRTDLIMVLLQRLVSLDIKDAERVVEIKSLFPAAWETTRNHIGDDKFDFAYTTAEATEISPAFTTEDVKYYRSLLQIIFLTLQPLRKRSRAPPPQRGQNARSDVHAPKEAQQLIQVVLHVIVKGFRSLSSILHEDAEACVPNDFVLLTALLQTILDIPGIELLHSQIQLLFANNNISGYATSLFSWSDKLVVDGDPVFGELAILFLLEMSSVPLIAESMAVEGVLSQLTSARIMGFFQRTKGMGPFDEPARLHSIWTRGILPICLNLLDAVGAPLAAEVVSFLNHFPNQLSRLASDLGNRNSPVGTRPSDSHMTLSIASEVHSLSLISLVISRYSIAGPSTGTLMIDIPLLKWDKAGIKEDVDDWVRDRNSLGGSVLPGNEREAVLSQRGVLEERVWGELKAAAECLGAEGA
ncbi:hypothetical protein EG328_010870 [Venturia inaequalis]|uniref:Nucleoporin n=1 Tax=Venturia inaequalis TaxID=5025 RepID=A0A8H3Z1Q5_VENIN|nr:hypothetical protein EG328_010870 [Venturia inaequalis]